MKAEQFKKRNSQSFIYKGAWNEDSTKITYWFEDGGKATLSADESKKVSPKWISDKPKHGKD